MNIRILSPQWGHEHLDITNFLQKIKNAGYDGIDTWIPLDPGEKRALFNGLQELELDMVSHQHRAAGSTFAKFRTSFLKELITCAEPMPLLINSHTGKDYFKMEQNIALVDMAAEFTSKTGILVAHETHRGCLGYSPQSMSEVFKLRPDIQLTADLSHWVCVTESMLENFEPVLAETFKRSIHIHARVGFEQGPQIADPTDPHWHYALEKFLGWWDKIVTSNAESGRPILPITTEFGPEPYMPKAAFSILPAADQFKINCFMKDLLRKRYQLIK